MKKEASLSIVEDVKNHKFLMIKHQRGINEGCMNFPGGKKSQMKRWKNVLSAKLTKKQV